MCDGECNIYDFKLFFTVLRQQFSKGKLELLVSKSPPFGIPLGNSSCTAAASGNPSGSVIFFQRFLCRHKLQTILRRAHHEDLLIRLRRIINQFFAFLFQLGETFSQRAAQILTLVFRLFDLLFLKRLFWRVGCLTSTHLESFNSTYLSDNCDTRYYLKLNRIYLKKKLRRVWDDWTNGSKDAFQKKPFCSMEIQTLENQELELEHVVKLATTHSSR